MAVCLNHTDTPAATRCAACGKPICEKCIVAGSYCSFECQEKADLAAGRTHQMMEGKARTDKKNRTVKTIIILILLAAAAAGAYYYMQNPKKANNETPLAPHSVALLYIHSAQRCGTDLHRMLSA